MSAPEQTLISINSAELRALLGDVQRGASGDGTLPMLNGILLHTDTHPRWGNVLVATSTDRYVMVQGSAQAQGALPRPVFLPLRQVAQVMAVARPYTTRTRAAVAQTEILVGEDSVTVRQVALPSHDLGTVTVTVPFSEAKFPKVAKLWAGATAGEQVAEPVAVAGKFLSLLGQLGDARTPVRLALYGATNSVVAHIGDRLSVLVMPARMSEPWSPLFFNPTPDGDVVPAERSAA